MRHRAVWLTLIVALTAAPSWAADIVQLRRGYYVRADVSCDRASRTTLVLFTGKAFGAQCTADQVVEGKSTAAGQDVQVSQTCRDVGYVSRETRLYRIADDHQFVVAMADEEVPYRLCRQDELPPPWATQDLSALLRCRDLD